MNETQKRFFELVKLYESTKENLKVVSDQLDQTMLQLGVGNFLQDDETGLVYKITEPTGTYVAYKAIGYERTKKDGEARGTLSKTEAEDQGFVLRK